MAIDSQQNSKSSLRLGEHGLVDGWMGWWWEKEWNVVFEYVLSTFMSCFSCYVIIVVGFCLFVLLLLFFNSLQKADTDRPNYDELQVREGGTLAM